MPTLVFATVFTYLYRFYAQTFLICVALIYVASSGVAFAQPLNTFSFKKPSEKCLTVEVFSDVNCPHCANAYDFLYDLQTQYADIKIISRDLTFQANRSRLIELSKKYNVERPGTPSFLICENFLVGFDNANNYGKIILYLMGLSDSFPDQKLRDAIVIPLFGSLSIEQLGMPLFTFIIGLIDGFNPCAMWVLLFLLSLLVNLKDRKKIVLIAGTFVLVSGVVYFAFMAAWLNLFLVIGFSRIIQIIVSIIALTIGIINIKDFIAMKKGFSLGIPESVKPGLYARMRRVIYAENTLAALLGVIGIAILVNLVELICTAGLPALYTQILSLKELQLTQYYAYLVLYNIAYILDDALMVTIVVYTLSRKKLQEKQGRWLKLLSGLVVLILGLMLLIKPDWLF